MRHTELQVVSQRLPIFNIHVNRRVMRKDLYQYANYPESYKWAVLRTKHPRIALYICRTKATKDLQHKGLPAWRLLLWIDTGAETKYNFNGAFTRRYMHHYAVIRNAFLLKRRLSDIGGSCYFESTIVALLLYLLQSQVK